jgi:ArsR family transcriptional regulator
MGDEKNLGEMENFFLALADKTRLRILNLMREGEICVCFLVEALDESQPKISRHLACLRGNGIVGTRRDGKWMHYKIIPPKDDFAAQVLRNTLVWISSQKKMQSDYEKFREICYSYDITGTISDAPKPDIFVKSNVKNVQSRELETFLL